MTQVKRTECQHIVIEFYGGEMLTYNNCTTTMHRTLSLLITVQLLLITNCVLIKSKRNPSKKQKTSPTSSKMNIKY